MQKRGQLFLIGGIIVVLVGVGLFLAMRLSSPTAEKAAENSQEAVPPQFDKEAIQAQLEAGDYAAARDALQQVVAADAGNAEAHFLLGLARFNLGEYPEARESFLQALELEPERASAVHHNLGVLAYQTGEMETAVQEFKSALEADPNDPDSHYQLGATYLQIASSTSDSSYLTQAEAEFQQVLKLSPGKPEALVGLGTLYMSQNKVDEAITLLEQAVQANPEMREALYALGLAYYSKGETALAQETLQKFLDTQPPERWAKEAQDILEQVGP
ncbi:MAG TPA: tetratricopeptide repeat protein [Anaerolineae bacterium]|nr:tetratricopeptide repeat protein [Anaerolineae bacterium]HQH39397.1 tetratricopeptide repeat protein [Anaerolineae bacterium]